MVYFTSNLHMERITYKKVSFFCLRIDIEPLTWYNRPINQGAFWEEDECGRMNGIFNLMLMHILLN